MLGGKDIVVGSREDRVRTVFSSGREVSGTV
jgi:hypothetical protein